MKTIEKVTPLKKGQCLNVNALEWFDRINGNSYFAGIIHIDNKEVLKMPFQYGYGTQYETEAGRMLVEAGYIPAPKERGYVNLYGYCRDNGVNYLCSKAENCKQREL